MNSRERYRRAITFGGPDRVPVMHRTIPGAFRRHGGKLEALYERYPSDVLLSPSTRAWFAFKRARRRGRAAALHGVTDEWGCVWDSLNDDYLGQVVGHPLDDWEKWPASNRRNPPWAIEGVHEMVESGEGRPPPALRARARSARSGTGPTGCAASRTRSIDVLEDRPEMYELRDQHHRLPPEAGRDPAPVQGAHRRHPGERRLGHAADPDDPTGVLAEDLQACLRQDRGGHQGRRLLRPPAHATASRDAIMDDLIEIGFDEINPQMSCMDIEIGGSPLRRQGVLPRGHGPAVLRCLRARRPRSTRYVRAPVRRLRSPRTAATSATARSAPTCPSRTRRPCWWPSRGSRTRQRNPVRPSSRYSMAIAHSLLAERPDSD